MPREYSRTPLVHLPAQANGVYRMLDVPVGKVEQALDDPHVLGAGEVPVPGGDSMSEADHGPGAGVECSGSSAPRR